MISQNSSATRNPIALVGGTLIDGSGKPPIENTVVLVDGKIVQHVGCRDQVTLPEGCQIINTTGKTVMPGLMDLHVHLVHGEEEITAPTLALPSHLDKPLILIGIKGFARAHKAFEMGFTTLRDVGDIGWLGVSVRDAIQAGIVEGPRIFASGQFLSTTGGQWDNLPNYITRTDILSNVVDGVDEVRRAVRQHVKMKTNWVKFCATGGVMNVREKTHNFSEDELRALVEEAHGKGLLVCAHCIHHRGALDAARAGVDSIEHGALLTEELIEVMVQKGTYLVPTLSAPYQIVHHGAEFGVPPIYIEKCRPVYEEHMKSFQMAHRAGVKIACGTDAGMSSVIHGGNALELELLVKNGMSPMDAIVTATKSSAATLRVEDKLGTVEKGKWADIVVVDGDPLADIKILQDKSKIVLVMKEGVIYHRRGGSI